VLHYFSNQPVSTCMTHLLVALHAASTDMTLMEASTIMAPPSDVTLESATQLVDGTSCCLLLANQRKRPATIASTAHHTAAAFRLSDHQQSGLARIHCQCPAAHMAKTAANTVAFKTGRPATSRWTVQCCRRAVHVAENILV